MARSELTPEQLRPATSRRARAYVEAAPGSGKTYLAVERFGYLRYRWLRRDPRGIAAVSFARSASAELKGRIVRRWGQAAGRWPNFVGTIDELHRRILQRLLETGHVQWPGGHTDLAVGDSWRQAPGARSRGQAGAGWLRVVLLEDGQLDLQMTTVGERPRSFYVDKEAYEEVLAQGRCTHDEVRAVVRTVLGSIGSAALQETAAFLTASFAHIVIDEAFDMNELDINLVRLMAASGIGVTVVGDPWQSLYEFRGSRPKLMKAFVAEDFETFTVLGSHRYRTEEMRELARQLSLGQPFSVGAPEPGRRPDVVLAARWTPLWEFEDLPVLPAGIGTNIDGGPYSAALLLLLNEVTTDRFEVAVTGFTEASAFVGWSGDRSRLQPGLAALSDPERPLEEVWQELHAGLGGSDTWRPPGRIAQSRLVRLATLVRSSDRTILGLSIHQAKGLQWPQVDLLHPVMEAGTKYRLEQENGNHRAIYVALTRAQDSVCVRTVQTRY